MNGNTVTDKKTLLGALDSMRKINADERRLAATNLQNTMRRLLPNAKFSIDKYDPKSFTTLVGSASGLTAEQRQELQAAQLAYDNANSKAQDLSTAFASVSGRGRIDPAVAERLGRPQSYVADIERNERRIDVIEFLALAEAIGVDPLRLLRQVREVPAE